MRQTLCDKCSQPIDLNEVIGDEAIVFVGVGTGIRKDAHWGEYHRRCARNLTIQEAWTICGRLPLVPL